MQLKKYQQDCLDKLREYAVECKKYPPEDGARFAFGKLSVSERQYQDFSDENNAPIVCIKVPTGGGKTLIAAHSVGVIFDSFLKERGDAGLVMWFVPSDAILKQTLRVLKNRTNDIRSAIDARFDAKVKVFNVGEAKTIKKSDIAENVCIVVSTLSAFRREQRDALKVFQSNGELMGHFEDLPERVAPLLQKSKNNEVVFSLANVIRLHNPFVVVDEGHNIGADLSFETIQVLNPSFVLEFTATPRAESNILLEIEARELQKQKMIKMPIRLLNVTPWEETILAGIKKRKELEESADKNKTGYIRPIMLIQAEQEKESEKRVFVQQIKKFLVDEARIDEGEIAIKTAKNDDLPDGEKLLKSDCPIRYIITVNALKEGWDCPFAYILVSVSNLGAALSVEQTIGRVMRLPYVREHAAEELNKAYVFGATNSFTKTADAVIEALKKNGYEQIEIEDGGVALGGGIAQKKVREEIKLPYINMQKENGVWRKLDYVEDIIGNAPLLVGVAADIGFSVGSGASEMIEIDFNRKGELVREKLGTYTVSDEWGGENIERLIAWLCKKVRREFISQKEMSAFVGRVLAGLLQKEGVSLKTLNRVRYELKEKLDVALDAIIEKVARKRFVDLEKKGMLKSNGESFVFPQEFSFARISREPFSKCVYDKADYLNKEEIEFIKKIDNLENVEWWVRNPKDSGFCLSGWKKARFFADFVVSTKNGDIFLIEYKGGQLKGSEDTNYKKELGEKWAELSGERFQFLLAEKVKTNDIVETIKKHK
ncbi:MAG: type III restriction protein res subunit [Parcubacteria group bacterium Gr01-1014_17]|nr:MAG: type III restriction protein res subunit [Parcubacteria group bacterium Gr01-1014_17]